MRRFLVSGDIFYKEKHFCKVEREIWAETGGAAKVLFEREERGQGFSVKHVVVKELK